MADIFLSYASEDRDTAGQLVEIFQKAGWSVFWDRNIPIGKSWGRVLEQELPKANAVTSLWSPDSVKSRWVLIEAEEGQEMEKLFPAMIAETKVPLSFKLTQYANLSDWDGSIEHKECKRLLTALAKHLGTDLKELFEAKFPPTDVSHRRRQGGHDVFLGYARSDLSIAETLAANLEQAGVRVWWDRAIAVGETFEDTILSALEEARAVIILWSRDGVQSIWLIEEAQWALDHGNLIGAFIEPVETPLGFRKAPNIDLKDWRGGQETIESVGLFDTLAKKGVLVRRKTAAVVDTTATDLKRIDELSQRFRWPIIAVAFIAGAIVAGLLFMILSTF